MTLQSNVVFLFSLVGAYWNILLLWVIALLCQREILTSKYPCDYSLLQKALVLFSKLFVRGALQLEPFEYQHPSSF